MHVAIVNLTSGGFSGGYRKYLRELLPRLAQHSDVRRLDVLMPPAANEAQRELSAHLSAVSAKTSVRRWSPGGAGTGRLRRELRGIAPDVVFVPTQRPLLVPGIPVVTMVRNMEPLVAAWEGNSWLDRAKNAARWVEARRACRSSDRVLAVSEYVRDFLVEHWKLPIDQVSVVYHGVDELPAGTVSRAPDTVRQLGGAPFLFTAGSIRPARGLEDLLRAWPDVLAARPSLRVLVAGTADSGAKRHFGRLRELADSLGIAESVVWLGALSAAEMAWCFEHAEAFVMTSRAEACPNIALEAMTHSATIVSTDGPPMPEFFGAAATYYRARNAGSLAASLQGVLSRGKAERETRRAEARARAASFTWDRTAAVTIAELQSVIRKQGRGST